MSVRLSVTRRYSVETAKHIINVLHNRVARPFKFLHTKLYDNIPSGTHLTEASNARGYEKTRFLTNISLYFQNDTRYNQSYYGRRIRNRNRTKLLSGAIFNDLE